MHLPTRREAIAAGTGIALIAAPRAWSRRPAPGQATGLLCNLLPAPFSVPCDDIRLSWIVAVESGRQRAYRIQIHRLGAARDLAWDSGEIADATSTAVAIPGAGLAPDTAYTWRVLVRGTGSSRSRWSAPAAFATAPDRWTAVPIWAGDAPWALLRRRFDVAERPVAAWLRAAAESPEKARQYVFRAWINGRFAGVGPVRSPSPDTEARYLAIEVTDLLRAGPNAIAALCYAGEGRAFQAELVLQYRNGRREIVSTDARWNALDGGEWRPAAGYTGGGFYDAPLEAIDARREPVGWRQPLFDDTKWPAAAVRQPLPALSPMTTEPIALRPRPPVATRRRPDGSLVLDFGQEAAAGLSVVFEATEPAAVAVSLGEELLPDGTVRAALRCGQTYRETWMLRHGRQTIEHWGYRGFRYAQIAVPATARLLSVDMLVLEMPWDERDASFRSSDDALDRVREFCVASIRATRLDIYHDTPTRERGPYEGDAIVNQLSEYGAQRSYALARYSTAYLARRPTWPTEYRLMPPILAWRDYLATGDDRLIRAEYDRMVDAQLVHAINAAGLVEKDPGQSSHVDGDLVDWPKTDRDGFVFTRVNTVVNAWQYAALRALASIAAAIGRDRDATRFAALADRLRSALVAMAARPDGTFRDGVGTDHAAQHATAFAIALGVVDGEATRRGAAVLATQGMRMSVYGAQFLLDALFVGGQANAAIALMTSRSDTSWLGMMDRWGATIAMEAWNPQIKPNTTFSHAWGTAPANVIPRLLAGVETTAPGAARVTIRPRPGTLRRFDATVPTIRGPIQLRYDGLTDEVISLRVPANVAATLELDADFLSGLRTSGQADVGGLRLPLRYQVDDGRLQLSRHHILVR